VDTTVRHNMVKFEYLENIRTQVWHIYRANNGNVCNQKKISAMLYFETKREIQSSFRSYLGILMLISEGDRWHPLFPHGSLFSHGSPSCEEKHGRGRRRTDVLGKEIKSSCKHRQQEKMQKFHYSCWGLLRSLQDERKLWKSK